MLAAGRATRLGEITGGGSKLLIPVGGLTLAERAVRKMEAITPADQQPDDIGERIPANRNRQRADFERRNDERGVRVGKGKRDRKERHRRWRPA